MFRALCIAGFSFVLPLPISAWAQEVGQATGSEAATDEASAKTPIVVCPDLIKKRAGGATLTVEEVSALTACFSGMEGFPTYNPKNITAFFPPLLDRGDPYGLSINGGEISS